MSDWIKDGDETAHMFQRKYGVQHLALLLVRLPVCREKARPDEQFADAVCIK